MQDSEIIILTISTATSIAVSLAFLIIYILFKNNQKQNILKSIFDKELLTAQLEIQEQTFQQISKELHDNVGHFLTIAKLNLDTLPTSSCKSTIHNIQQASFWINHSLEDIRTLSKSMDKDYIVHHGLLKMLEKHIEKLKKNRHFAIKLEVLGEEKYLDEKADIMLFRIIQEAINNIIKHSKANNIIISLNYTKDYLKCSIGDDGIGFNVQEKLNLRIRNESSGLQNIIRRAKMINASHEINSTNKGTTLCITIPF